MPNRIEDLFSVERLRRTWNRESPPERGAERGEEEPDTESRSGLSASVLTRRLRSAILRAYSPAAAGILEPLLDELEQQLQLRFPVEPGSTLSREDASALNRSLETVLNRLEDLAEALEIGKQ
jgi:hypothetical protein